MNSLERLKSVWTNEGINPKKHYKAKAKLKKEWPLLYSAIDNILDEYKKIINE